MGANLQVHTIKDSLGRERITEMWNAAVEESLYEDGHSYSGGIGMLEGPITWVDKNFSSYEEAEEYIDENHEKWDPAMAVSYTRDDGVKFWAIGGWCSE